MLNWSSSWPWGLRWVGDLPSSPPLVRRDAGFFPTPRTLDLSFLWLALVHRVSWGHQQAWSLGSHHPPSWEGPLPGTPPHQRRRGKHFTSSLNSFTLLASRCGLLPAGGSIFSAQCWRALAYATAFSQGNFP